MERDNSLLTPEELAEQLRIPKSTLYKLCNDGEIPAVKVGRHWRFDRQRVDRWLADKFAESESGHRHSVQPIGAESSGRDVPPVDMADETEDS